MKIHQIIYCYNFCLKYIVKTGFSDDFRVVIFTKIGFLKTLIFNNNESIFFAVFEINFHESLVIFHVTIIN